KSVPKRLRPLRNYLRNPRVVPTGRTPDPERREEIQVMADKWTDERDRDWRDRDWRRAERFGRGRDYERRSEGRSFDPRSDDYSFADLGYGEGDPSGERGGWREE